MEAKTYADITISIDCDGQDDINTINDFPSGNKSGQLKEVQRFLQYTSLLLFQYRELLWQQALIPVG